MYAVRGKGFELVEVTHQVRQDIMVVTIRRPLVVDEDSVDGNLDELYPHQP